MKAMPSPRDTHLTRLDTTPEGELSALATIYRRAIDRYEETCHAKENAAGVPISNGGEPKGSRNDRPAEPSIP